MEEKQKEKKKLTLREKLVKIQTELKVPKGQQNTFGNYKFRSCEDILEKLKPFETEYNVGFILSDEVVLIGDNEPLILEEDYWDEESKRVFTKKTALNGQRFYIKSAATIFDVDSEETIINYAYAREEETKKGMDASQITGAASSYARKYALNGLLGLDDVKDADTNEFDKTAKIGNEKIVSRDEAENYIFQTGKHKNKKLLDVYNTDYEYLEWLIDNKKANPTLLKCIEVLDTENTKINLISQMTQLEIDTGTDHEEILKYFEVDSNQNMTVEQLQEAIKIMNKKSSKKNTTEKTPYDF